MSIDYPQTRQEDRLDVLHGVEVADPYRWLEDPDSEETKAWVAAQNRLSRAHLDALPSRAWFHDTMLGITGSPRTGTPERVGDRYLLQRNDGTQEQDQLFVAESLEELGHGGGRLLVDPLVFSTDGTASLAWYDATEDGSLLAYQISEGGSDWTTIRVRDVATGADLDDEVAKVKFSAATWLPDGRSFLYLHFPTEGSGTGTEADALPGGRLRHHVLGTAQSQDALVWHDPDNPGVLGQATLSHDGRWLALHISEGTSEKNRLWMLPVSTDDHGSTVGEPVRLFDTADAAYEFVRTVDDGLLLRTDREAPLGRLVRVDLVEGEEDGEEHILVDVVPESADALRHVAAVGEELVAVHLVDAQPRLTRWSPAGRQHADIEVLGGALVGLHGKVGRSEVLIGTSSVVDRLIVHRLDLTEGDVQEVEGLAPPGEASWTPPQVHVERRRATSADGTPVPYFLVRTTGGASAADGEPGPTLLYGYGGFDIALFADFRAVFAGWLSAGGVLAIANLRGGGEYGAAWHDAGRLDQKQHVFDDFAAVGDHLVETGVTSHAQLAVHGGSNGGLLVGATMLQRPDLAAVALPAVGVLDMLRFHLFTIGRAWTADYGSPEDPAMFPTLLAYSPLHNVVPGTAYPATLVTTGDHDDRVVPAHSFKFTATLQAAQAGDAPVLARIETATGHGAGKPARVVAAECADLLAFAADVTGLDPTKTPL